MKKLLTILTILVLSAGMSLQLFAQNSCPTPTNLTSSNVTETSAALSWTSALTSSYNIIEFRAQGAPNWISQIVQAIPYTLQNLPCATTIEWRVQSACNINGTVQFSPFSATETFTTLVCTSPCPVPTGLNVSNVTATTALLSWTAPSGVFMYNVRYQQAGSANFITINNINSTTHPLQNLNCNTPYVFQVQSVCMNNTTGTTTLSQWSPLFTFITSACSSNCPPPQNPVTTNITQTGAVLTWVAPSPNYTVFNIRYRVPGSLNWTVINNVNTPYQLGNLICGTSYEWEAQTVCPNTAGAAALSAWSPSISFSTAVCPVSCAPPTSLNASNFTATGVLLTWATAPAPASSYRLRYRVSGTTTWTVIGNVSSPWQLNNLLCNTAYQWQVRSVCPVLGTTTVNYSAWSPSNTFSTLACPAPCATPQSPATANITASDAQLSWVGSPPPAASYEMRYRKSGATTWTTISNAVSPYQLSNLSCGTVYEWQVRAFCPASTPNSNSYSTWSPLVVFTTAACPGGCFVPFNLQSSNITASGVSLSWTLSPPATSYEVRYRVNGTTAWTVVSNAGNPYQAGNLVCNTSYQWQVRSVCPAATSLFYSAWSATASFTTSSCNTNSCAVPTGLAANVSATGGLLSWSAVAGASSYNIRYKPVNATTYVNASGTATFLQVGNLNPGTVYEFQVQAVCISPTGITSLSQWSPSFTFTTPLLLTLYPNPATEKVTIRYESNEVANAVVEVRDMFGKVVSTNNRTLAGGTSEWSLNVSNLQDGWYSVCVKTGSQVTTQKLFVGR